MQHYISEWRVYTETLGQALERDLGQGLVRTNWAVWRGPSGDALVADEWPDEDYADYIESGTVDEYLAE